MPLFQTNVAVSGLPAGVSPVRRNRFDPAQSGYNWKASNTERLRASLARAQAGSGIANHAFIGDSTTSYFNGTGGNQLTMWPRIYRSILATNLGVTNIAGTGTVVFADAGTGPFDSRWTTTGTWTNNILYRSSSTSAATAVFTPDGGQVGTTMNLWYYGTSAAFTVKIDAGTAVAVTPTGGLTVQKYSVAVSAATHTMTVTTSSASAVHILAAELTGTSGLTVHNLGLYGSTAAGTTASAWLPTTDATYPAVARTNILASTPDVVWIALGVNDILATGGNTIAATISALQTIAGRFPNSDVILVSQYQQSGVTAWPAFVAALYDLADTLNVPLLDMFDRSQGYTSANTGGLMGDTIHPSLAGQRDWGRAAAFAAGGV